MVFPGRYSPEIFLKLIETEKVTFTHCVPTILQMLLAAPGSDKVDLSPAQDGGRRLGAAAVAGARGAGARHRHFRRLRHVGVGPDADRRASQVRNISAATSRTSSPIASPAGIAAPLVDLRVVDENMTDVPHDGETIGEIVVRAPWLTMGYLNNREASESLWGGGYMHTGDVASIDAEGYIRIADRLKDIVKSGGEWISSIALENIIMEKPGVRRAAVIPDEGRQVGRAAARRWSSSNRLTSARSSEDDIRLHVASYVERGVISKIAIPENVSFVAELPLTSVGKIDKKQLRASLLVRAARHYSAAAITGGGGGVRPRAPAAARSRAALRGSP